MEGEEEGSSPEQNYGNSNEKEKEDWTQFDEFNNKRFCVLQLCSCYIFCYVRKSKQRDQTWSYLVEGDGGSYLSK